MRTRINKTGNIGLSKNSYFKNPTSKNEVKTQKTSLKDFFNIEVINAEVVIADVVL